jgi:hypothetical protein
MRKLAPIKWDRKNGNTFLLLESTSAHLIPADIFVYEIFFFNENFSPVKFFLTLPAFVGSPGKKHNLARN